MQAWSFGRARALLADNAFQRNIPMKHPCCLAVLIATLAGVSHVTLGAPSADANPPVPVSVFTARDLPEIEPGKPLWDGTRGCGVAYYDKWVYAVTHTENILQFECDAATAKLTYKGAMPLGYEYTNNATKGVQIFCWIRRTEDNLAKLVVFYGDHDKGCSWYGIDKHSGKLTPEGKQVPAPCDHHNATQLMAPDQQHFFYGGRVLDKVDWYRFGPDGAPVPDGSFAMKNFSTGNVGMSSGCAMTSPDWKHMYYAVFQCVDKDPKSDKAPFIDAYALDPKTHAPTYVSSLELPVPETVQGRISGTLTPFSPDGKFTYAIFVTGESYYCYTLSRDPTSGALKIASKTPVIKDRMRTLTGPPWGRQDRFVYTADGTNGYYAMSGPLGHFSRNLATGELTILPPNPDAGVIKLALDPVNGILFTVGEKISSFKVGGTKNPKESK